MSRSGSALAAATDVSGVAGATAAGELADDGVASAGVAGDAGS
jgi:hypothetical protein